MANYAKHLAATPQTEPAPGGKTAPNSAGGYCFEVDDWTRLRRFLVLGCEGGTYYASERTLTVQNAACVARLLDVDYRRVVDVVCEVSCNGVAPRQDPAVLALALAASHKSKECRKYALSKLSDVCRTGTHLFAFNEAVKQFRGRGRLLKEAVQRWYSSKDPRDLAYQVTKYQSRNGWSHRDLLRLSRPKFENPGSNTVAAWAVGKLDPLVPESCTPGGFLDPIVGLEKVKRATAVKEVVKLIQDYRLVREVVPTEHLNSPEVWEALLEEMPVTAMIRNLGKMTQVGLLKPLSAATKKVVERLQSRERFKSARVHPMSVLLALRTYQKGHGDKGKLSWEPVGSVVSALDDAFYHAFYGVEPTYKNWLIGLDVSGSMSSPIMNSCLSCCEAAAALSLVTLATEPWTEVMGFCDSFVKLGLTKGMRLDTALQKTSRLNFGRTDCSLPMVYAADRKLEVDVFLVITDNETYAGSVHPYQALANYRQKMGRPAKLIVMGMTATNFSIADPSDAGMLDVIGMDSTAPQVMADFARS